MQPWHITYETVSQQFNLGPDRFSAYMMFSQYQLANVLYNDRSTLAHLLNNVAAFLRPSWGLVRATFNWSREMPQEGLNVDKRSCQSCTIIAQYIHQLIPRNITQVLKQSSLKSMFPFYSTLTDFCSMVLQMDVPADGCSSRCEGPALVHFWQLFVRRWRDLAHCCGMYPALFGYEHCKKVS